MHQYWIWEQSNWPKFYWDENKISPMLAQARLNHGKILGIINYLNPAFNLEAMANILVQDSLTTSAIEGEKLDLESIRSSVARHLGLSTAGLKIPPRAVDGLVEVLLDATKNFEIPLTYQRLCGWQAALFPSGYSGIYKIRTGELRGEEPMQVVSGPVGREKIHFIAPPREQLETLIKEFLLWFNEPSNKIDGFIRAGLAHLWFVTIHPFEDGNGRLARAITDMAIAQDERQPMRYFSLSAQILKERENYYKILENTQRNGLDVTNWLFWFLEQIKAACIDAKDIMANTITKAHFWLQFQSLDLNERQRKVLNRLLDAGPEGFKGGINTRKYMSMTKSSRATAYRELADLVQKGCLLPMGKGGRSSAYDIPWSLLNSAVDRLKILR